MQNFENQLEGTSNKWCDHHVCSTSIQKIIYETKSNAICPRLILVIEISDGLGELFRIPIIKMENNLTIRKVLESVATETCQNVKPGLFQLSSLIK